MPTKTKYTRAEKAYKFFSKAEKSGQRFTLQGIRENTGYRQWQANQYLSQRWFWFLHEDSPGQYYCNGVRQFTMRQFAASHDRNWDAFISLFVPTTLTVTETGKIHPRLNAGLLLLFVLIAMATLYKHRQKWRLRIWKFSLPL